LLLPFVIVPEPPLLLLLMTAVAIAVWRRLAFSTDDLVAAATSRPPERNA
jgi:hypothetical protein